MNGPGKGQTDCSVILVNLEDGFSFPFGYAYLDGYLRQEGTASRVLFPKVLGQPRRELVNEIMDFNPAVVGFGSLYHSIYEIKEIISMLDAARRNFTIVLGGQLVTPIPEFVLRKTKADIAVLGEGEITFSDLVKALLSDQDITGIKGLAIRDGDDVTLTGEGESIQDLSNLPSIHWESFPMEKFINVGRHYSHYDQNIYLPTTRAIWIHGGRGCPFKCNFCYHLHEFRLRKISDIVAESKELKDRFNLNMLLFSDDLVVCSKKRTLELAELLIKEKLDVEYCVSARFDLLDEDIVRALRESGCKSLGLGIESGSQRVLDQMNKRITIEQINEGMRLIKKYGMIPSVTIQMGQPGETREEINASVDLLLSHVDANTVHAITITTPYPGSPLYDYALQNGYLKDHEDFYNRYKNINTLSVNFTQLDDGELTKLYRQAIARCDGKKARSHGLSTYVRYRTRQFLQDTRRRIGQVSPQFVKDFYRRYKKARW